MCTILLPIKPEYANKIVEQTKLYELEYEVDNEKYKGLYSLILISNANRIAGFNNIYKDVKLNDILSKISKDDILNFYKKYFIKNDLMVNIHPVN